MVTTTTTKKKSYFKELPNGGFESNGIQYDKSGTPTAIVNKQGVQTYERAKKDYEQRVNDAQNINLNSEKVYTQEGTDGFYYELEPGPRPISQRDGRFKPVKDLTVTDALAEVERKGGNRTNLGPKLGDQLQGAVGPSKLPENVEAGVMTLTPTEARAYKGKIDRPYWVTQAPSPSESVKEGSYMANTNLLKSPFKWDTAGSYEFNSASIEIGRRAYQGIDITDQEVFRAQKIARQQRQGLNQVSQAKIIVSSVGQSGAQFGLGAVDLSLNLLGTATQTNPNKPFKWGDASISNKFKTTRLIMSTPNEPNLSGFSFTKPSTYGKIGSYGKELLERPKVLADIGLTAGTVGLVGKGSIDLYRAERVAGATKLGALNAVAGETVASFNPYFKIPSGVMGYKVNVGKPVQVGKPVLDTYKVGNTPAVGDNLGKTLYTFEGGATWNTPKTLTYGSVRTSLTGGTQPKITTVNANTLQFTAVAGLGEATNSVPSESYAKGYKLTYTIDQQFRQVNKYTFGTQQEEFLTGRPFKAWGTSTKTGKFSLGTSKVFYTDENNVLSKTMGIGINKELGTLTNNDFKVTYGSGYSRVVEEGQVKNIRARTRFFEPLKESSVNFDGEGAGSGGYKGGRGGVVSRVGTVQKNAIESPVKGILEPTPFQDNVKVNIPKSGTLTGSRPAVGLAPSLGQISKNILQQPVQVPYLNNVQRIRPIQTPQSRQGSLTTTKLPVLNIPTLTNLTPTLTPTLGDIGRPGNTPSYNPGLFVPGLPLGLGGDGFGSLKFGKVPAITTPKGYTPSFSALFFKIRGKKSSGPYTGFEFRPISGNKLTPAKIKRVRRK